MWFKWHDRFKKFGARRVEFITSKKGGSKAGTTVTGAKALLFFSIEDLPETRDLEDRFKLEWFVNKMICTERLEVCILEDEDFAYQTKDPKHGDFDGTKEGHPILQFTPTGLPESKGKNKHRPGLIISRAFRLKKHRQ